MELNLDNFWQHAVVVSTIHTGYTRCIEETPQSYDSVENESLGPSVIISWWFVCRNIVSKLTAVE